MNSTTTTSFVPAGSQLHAELSRLLRRGMGYTIQGAADIVAHVDQFGTARESCADVEDVQAINDLVRRHYASVEADPADWPQCFDDDVWALTDAEPANVPLPPEAYLPRDDEPSFEDRRAWAEIQDREERVDNALDRSEEEAAALVLLTASLDAYPAPVCGAAPEGSGYAVGYEADRQRWVLRLDGRAVFQSREEAPVRDEMKRRTSVRSRPVTGWNQQGFRRAVRNRQTFGNADVLHDRERS